MEDLKELISEIVGAIDAQVQDIESRPYKGRSRAERQDIAADVLHELARALERVNEKVNTG